MPRIKHTEFYRGFSHCRRWRNGGAPELCGQQLGNGTGHHLRRLPQVLQKQIFIGTIGVPLYTDARLYGEAGIPVVLYGAGPRTVPESNAKRADENLLLEDLRKATQVVACAVAELLTA